MELCLLCIYIFKKKSSIVTKATPSHFRAEQYKISNGQNIIAIKITNNINGHNSEGIDGANNCVKSIYIITDCINNINAGNY